MAALKADCGPENEGEFLMRIAEGRSKGTELLKYCMYKYIVYIEAEAWN